MRSLSEELLTCHDDIVNEWYKAWRLSTHPHPEIGEAALKNSLPAQLILVGEQLRDLDRAEAPETLWKIFERLAPEKRVGEEVPIEEVVQEYGLAVRVVRDCIENRQIQVPFKEYSYFYQALFELTAESVRRYAKHQSELVSNARGAYLAGVMHQLRTPLSALAMSVQVMEKSGQIPDVEAFSRLERNVRRMRFLVDSVLRIERYRPEEVPVRPETLYPFRLIDEIMSDHEQDAMQKGLRFEAHVNRTLSMTLDPELFSDAVGNLVQNAVKYTTAGFVIVEAEERPDDVMFRVRDSGPGLSEDQRRTVLQHIQPGSAGGAGIGLQVAQHAAMAQGGELGLESEVGKGSTFWVRLPRAVSPRSGDAAGGSG